MARPSIFAEVAADYANSTADSAQTVKALLAVAGYYYSTPASGANSYADVISAFQAAGVPAPVVEKVKQVFGSKLAPHI